MCTVVAAFNLFSFCGSKSSSSHRHSSNRHIKICGRNSNQACCPLTHFLPNPVCVRAMQEQGWCWFLFFIGISRDVMNQLFAISCHLSFSTTLEEPFQINFCAVATYFVFLRISVVHGSLLSSLLASHVRTEKKMADDKFPNLDSTNLL